MPVTLPVPTSEYSRKQQLREYARQRRILAKVLKRFQSSPLSLKSPNAQALLLSEIQGIEQKMLELNRMNFDQ